MSKSLSKRMSLCNYICAALMLVLIVFQFLPFWHYNGEASSINGYVWFPGNHESLTTYLSSSLGTTVTVNDVIIVPIIQLITALVGATICIANATIPLGTACSVICGVAGVCGYIFNPILKLGSSWWLHLIISIGMLAVGIAAFVFACNHKDCIDTEVTVSENDKLEFLRDIRVIENVDDEKSFNQLINMLKNDDADYRIAAAEKLALSSKEAAFTHVSYCVINEKDEKVIATMKNSLGSIRKNMRLEHTA